MTNSACFHHLGWNFQSHKGTIATQGELERISKELDLPMPTMVFPFNHLSLQAPNGQTIVFQTQGALSRVDNRQNAPVRVAASAAWLAARQHHTEIKNMGRVFDWTYTTDYNGTLLSKGVQFEASSKCIDYDRLRRHDPILFYDENILFEDELADHGLAQYAAKIRVMPTCFFVLGRFYLRLESTLFRVNETRIYHEFGSDFVLREYSSREAPFDDLCGLSSAATESNKLMDPNWVSSKLRYEQAPVVEELIL